MTHYIHLTSKTNAQGKGALFRGGEHEKHPVAGTNACDSWGMACVGGHTGLAWV